jgi:hypothetical protein
MRYEDQAFEHETISLDGNEYFRCTFKNCTLTFAGTAPVNITPFVADGLNVQFLGAAKAGAELQLALMSAGAAQAAPGSVIEIGGKWWKQTDKPEGLA